MRKRAHAPGLRVLLLAVLAAVAGSVVAAVRETPAVAPTVPAAIGREAPRHGCAKQTAAHIATASAGGLIAPNRTVVLPSPFRVTPRLAGSHTFPVAGGTPVVDTFGAIRSDTGWHHGDDLFAPRGTPVVAAATGIVFSVGWQRLGGRRLWLRDASGNEFYYAHLNAYARRLRSGEEVQAGDILGYVGTSGDAEQTPAHLHFEIHPASLLGLGYDGAVDPTHYLEGWPRVHGRAIPPPAVVKRTSCRPPALALGAAR